MKNLRIGTKLGAAFGVLIAMLVGAGWLGVSRMARINAEIEEIVGVRWAQIQRTDKALARVNDNARITLQYFLITDKDGFDQLLSRQDENKREITELMEGIEAGLTSDRGRQLFAAVKQSRVPYVESFTRARKHLDQGRREEATAVATQEMIPNLLAFTRAWQDYVGFEAELMAEAVQSSAATYTTARQAMLALVLLAVAFAAVTAVVATRGLTQPVGDLVAAAEKIAAGDLRVQVAVDRGDELGRLQGAMKEMSERMAVVIGEVRAGAGALSTAAAQVSATSQSLAQGTSEQASSVEETTSSLEEMSASITQNAENSRQTEQMAQQGAADAEESGRAVRESAAAMTAIAERISIVEEIAYQTNLLALNAAIEAARAGEHGRGFAVVATEVRRLAESSQKAAKEISGLSASSVKVASRSGALLEELVPSIRKTADLVQEVAAASSQQSAGVAQINRAMAQVDQITQRNASATEELATTAEEMATQADALSRLVGFFQVTDADPAVHPRSASPRPRSDADNVGLLSPVFTGKVNGRVNGATEHRDARR